jgi:tetratricopeptide (TPR) repeat protein
MRRIIGLVAVSAIVAGCSTSPGSETATALNRTDSGAPEGDVIAGLGSHHHPITTSIPRAQQMFDQGFVLVYAFNHEEAVRSFQRAAELDPKAAMPQWGIAWALGPNYNLDIDDPRARQATDAIARAKTLAASGSQAERDYVAAMAVRYSADPKVDRAALARRYADAMRALTERYPDDLDAATLYAESLMNLRPWKLWTLDGQPAEDTEQILQVLDRVLRRDPQHIGANHYYIHSIEASPTPERGLPSAERLKTLAPAAGHLVHMPAHILARTGDHAGAALANLAGANADRAYMPRTKPDSFYVMAYYSHNLHFLVDSHMMQGRFGDARQAANELADRLVPHADMMPMIESMAVAPMNVLLRFGKYDDAIAVPAPPENRPVMTAWWHFTRGVAFARTGRVDQAVVERTALDAAVSQVPATALFGGTGLESATTVLEIAKMVLDARIAQARAATDMALAHWARAVAAADRLAYDEPPVWFYPLRESFGATLLAANRAADAERVFREDLVHHPRNPRALFGLRESLKRQQKAADADWVDRAFTAGWKNADSMLSIEGL